MSEDKSFMSKLTKPFKLHSRSSSKSEETDPATTREVLDAAYLEGRTRGEKERFGGSTSGGAYGSAGGLAGLKGLDGPYKSVIEQAYHEGYTKGQHESKVTGSNALPYYKSTTSPDPTVLASSSVGKVVSQPPAVQRHAIERPLAGDFANQKQPTDREVVHDTKHGHNAAVAAASAAAGGAAGAGAAGAAGHGSSKHNHHDPEDAVRGQAINSSTVESTSKNSEGLVENSQPAYTDDSQVRQGTGFFFNPKDTQGGAYNNNDGRFPEATQATINSRKDLRTEPTGYATEGGYHNPVAHPENTYLVGQGTTTEEKSGLKRGEFAGGVEGIGAAGVGGAVLASKHKLQSDYDAKVAELDAEIDATQRDIDALHLGHKGSSDSASTDAVYDEPLASKKLAGSTNAAATSLTGTSSHTSKKAEHKAYQQGVHNAAYNAGADKAIAQQQQHQGATQGAYTSGVTDRSYQSGVEHGAYDVGAATSHTQPSTTGAAVDKSTGPHTNAVRTSDPNQPGVLDGAKGALGAAAALAAGAVGYGAHESSNTAGANTHSTNSNAGVIGSGDKVYTDHRSLDPTTTAATHHDASNRPDAHSDSSGVMGGIAGAIGGAAAAMGLNPHGETTHGNATAQRTEQDPNSTGGVLSSLGWGSGEPNTVHSKNHDVTHASQAADSSTTNKDLSHEQTTPRGNAPDNSGGITSGIKNAAGAAAAATGAAAAATGLSSNSSQSQSHNTRSPVGGSGAGSEKESLIATAVRNHPDVKEEPAHPSSGNVVQEKKPETSDSTGPADEDSGPKRDLEAEMVEHNRKHGIKNDDRSLIEIAEQNSEEVKRAAAHHGKSGVLEEEDESKKSTGDNVQPVPAEVFQNQNTFTRTGGKHGSPNESTTLRGDSHSEHHSTSLRDKHHEATDRHHGLDATGKHHGLDATGKHQGATTGAAAGAATGAAVADSKSTSRGAHNENTTPHGSSLVGGRNSLAAGAPSSTPVKSTGATAPAAGAAASDERYHSQHHGSNKNLPLTPQDKAGFSQNETKPLNDGSSNSKATGLGGILGGIVGGKKQETDSDKDLSKQEHQELYRQGAQQGAYEAGEVKAAKDVSSKQATGTGVTGAAVGGASGAGYSHHQSQQGQGEYVPPVGEDKDIGEKYHKQHEAVKSKLEQDAEEGRLGNVQPDGVSSGSITSGQSHGHSGVAAGAVAGGATGAAGAAALGSGGSHRGHDGAAPSNNESLTVEVVGVKDEAAASKIAHQASKELLDKGVDLSSGKLVINTETKEIYKANEGSTSGSSQPRGSAAGIAGQQGSEYVPPVGQDKNIGNKYHQQHEAVKSKLEQDAEEGRLGNVGQPEGSGYASTGQSDHAGTLGGAGPTGHSTGKSASEIVVTVRGTQDSAAANHIASETVQQLKSHPDLLRDVKELQIDSNTGDIFDERGNKIATAAIAGQSSSGRSTSNPGSATTGQSSNETYTHPTKGPAESTNLASSTTGATSGASSGATSGATSGAPTSNEPVQMPGSFIS